MSDTTADFSAGPPHRPGNKALKRILKDPAAIIAAILLLLIVGAAVLAPLIAPFDPYNSNMRLRFCPIGSPRCPGFLLGADQQGRDMLKIGRAHV